MLKWTEGNQAAPTGHREAAPWNESLPFIYCSKSPVIADIFHSNISPCGGILSTQDDMSACETSQDQIKKTLSFLLHQHTAIQS